MKFTTPCFVRVEDAEELKELMDWLSQLGYEIRYWDLDGYIRIIQCWTTPKGIGRAVGYPCKQVRRTDIDCGTDIELFKALAAMNDDPSQFKHQWVINEDGHMCLCEYNNPAQLVIRGMLPHSIGLRKATAEEIIEHFKNRER